eukprot:9473206-Alexandrium_andersonii.AAC.1
MVCHVLPSFGVAAGKSPICCGLGSWVWRSGSPPAQEANLRGGCPSNRDPGQEMAAGPFCSTP